ncbi:MAG: hypothetical protein Athens041674_844 [Parcubacteria group bacterium Athens0416_74]|nr:MAG: hypothetical protein Athens041674_844 [Parcubacteria group bacterium Athens0416_74]
MGGAAILVLSVFIGGLFLLTGVQRLLLSSPQVAAVVSSTLVDLTNGDRAANNLASLSLNPRLVAVAQAKANDMAAKSYFSHISPEGRDPWYWFKQEKYAFEYAGENLAVDFSDSMDVERAWMNSSTHRKNILDPHFTEIGIATAVGTYQGKSTIFVAQAFGKPSAQRSQPRVQAMVIPENPSETAVAKAESAKSDTAYLEVTPLGSETAPSSEDRAVLGTSVEQGPAKKAVAAVQPAVAAELAVAADEESKPYWTNLVSFPRETLRIAYFIFGLLILLALAVDTGLEIRAHHRRRAVRAGVLLISMAILFVAAEIFFFVEPVIALTAASSL